MSKSLRSLSAFFAGIGTIGFSVSAQAQTSDLIYMQTMNLATNAITACYSNASLEDCDKLNQIKTTLMSWCQQSNDINSKACSAYRDVSSIEVAAMDAQNARLIR